MRKLLGIVALLYRRWRYVEEEAPAAPKAASGAASETPQQELERLRLAMAREERRLEDFRRNHCTAFVQQCESSIRFIRSRIHALELSPRS